MGLKLIKEKDGKEVHEYFDDTLPWVKWHSVSALKATAGNPFDAFKKAISASKNPRSKWFQMDLLEILEAWESTRDEGTAKGTMVHEVIENYLTGEITEKEEELKMIDSFVEATTPLKMYDHLKEDKILCETPLGLQIKSKDNSYFRKSFNDMKQDQLIDLILDSPFNDVEEDYIMNEATVEELIKLAQKFILNIGYCGTIDIVHVRKTRAFRIIDIKTDKNFKNKGFWLRDQRRNEMMPRPFSHMHDSDLEVYALQIWLYIILFLNRYPSMKVEQPVIAHWNRKKEVFTLKQIPNRYKEARLLIAKYFKLN